MTEQELYHHGVLGMKWGVRKSRSTSGSSKSKRTTKDSDKEIKKNRKQMSSARRHLSDGDLDKAIKRLQSEKKLKELTAEDVAPGKTAAKKMLTQIGKAAIGTAGAAVATYSVKAAMEGHFDVKEAAKFIKPKK